jgi:uncharacterized membrane protein
MGIHFVAYLGPLLVIVASIPMALGRVAPNHWYGFRTPKTLSSPEIWYPANRASGWWMVLGGALTILANLMLWWFNFHWDERRLVFWMAMTMTVFLSVSVVGSFRSFVSLRKITHKKQNEPDFR